MTTLDDLRTSLAREAETAPTGHHVARVREVRRRVAVRRQRQRVAAALVALAAVGTAATVSSLDRPSQTQVAGERVFGIDVPETLTSLGWSYGLDSVASVSDSRLELRLPASDRPRLLSWATSGDDDSVVLTVPGWETTYASTAADFGDFVWLAPGSSGVVEVQAEDDGVALATYDVDVTQPPAGVGEGAGTFRRDVAGRPLLAAVAGEPGETALSVEVDVPSGRDTTLGLAFTCADAPRGAKVHVSVAGEPGDLVFGECRGEEFDPGGSINSSFEEGAYAGRRITLEVRVARGGETLTSAEAPEARLGLAAYDVGRATRNAAGMAFPEVLESRGKVWQMVGLVTGEPDGLAVEAPADGTHLVAGASDAAATMQVLADGRPVGGDFAFGTGPASFGEVLLPPGARTVELRLRRAEGDETALALYRMES